MIYHEINDESNDDIDIFRLNFFKTIKKKWNAFSIFSERSRQK